MKNLDNQTKFQRRIKERHFWFYLGVITLIVSTIFFFVFIISSFLGLSFYLFNKLLNISLYGIFIGSIFTLFLSRLGWSESWVIDLLLNRLSILFMIGGLTLEVSNIFLGNLLYSQELSYGYVVTIIGIILWLLGVRFQSSTIEYPKN